MKINLLPLRCFEDSYIGPLVDVFASRLKQQRAMSDVGDRLEQEYWCLEDEYWSIK